MSTSLSAKTTAGLLVALVAGVSLYTVYEIKRDACAKNWPTAHTQAFTDTPPARYMRACILY